MGRRLSVGRAAGVNEQPRRLSIGALAISMEKNTAGAGGTGVKIGGVSPGRAQEAEPRPLARGHQQPPLHRHGRGPPGGPPLAPQGKLRRCCVRESVDSSAGRKSVRVSFVSMCLSVCWGRLGAGAMRVSLFLVYARHGLVRMHSPMHNCVSLSPSSGHASPPPFPRQHRLSSVLLSPSLFLSPSLRLPLSPSFSSPPPAIRQYTKLSPQCRPAVTLLSHAT
ncbi:hypothetical protein C7M84_010203 [Penaeus vannamei]|uniref:Uncharacterized protein n=1 Tax=Penaeus vannamei TaxID=6689 RepID=A0A3R7MAJ6_PENVA|nr:hypothetical protein C7M84_010203 [Penaeus vannamei]